MDDYSTAKIYAGQTGAIAVLVNVLTTGIHREISLTSFALAEKDLCAQQPTK
jgi:hypothetical protein